MSDSSGAPFLNILIPYIQDMTEHYACVYRGLMLVVEQNDDLFSWKKYNNYRHLLICTDTDAKMLSMW
jgi:hypothetical protein